MRNKFNQASRAQLLSLGLGLGLLAALLMGGVALALIMSGPDKQTLWTTIPTILKGALLSELGLLGGLVGGVGVVWWSGGFKSRPPRADK